MVEIRELARGETHRLEECLRELAEHHNAVSVSFRGKYPKKPFGETLRSFEEDLRSGRSRIAVAADGDRILGFCKVCAVGAEGTVDYLVVLKEARGRGLGDRLFGWALDVLKDSGAERVEIKVVEGNGAAGFYERYGFRTCSRVLRLDLPPAGDP